MSARDELDRTVPPAIDPRRPDRVPGWYGKLPGIGDFATRRLPPAFIALWDQWLQRCVAASQADLGADWLAVFLNSPVWRFALAPGACGPAAWAGVLMPSVDRVGRYFPMTIAVQVDPPVRFSRLVAQEAWFDAIEAVALGCLAVTVRPDDVETRLHQHPLPALDGADAATARLAAELHRADGRLLTLPASPPLDRVLAAAEHAALAETSLQRSLWWTNAGGERPSVIAAMHGLPPAGAYSGMLRVREG